jgi:hypothetical protein
MESLQNLHCLKIIAVSDNGEHIEPKKASHVMSRHLVSFHAMKLIIELPHDPGPLHILQMLSGMEGMHFPVRKSEKVRYLQICVPPAAACLNMQYSKIQRYVLVNP